MPRPASERTCSCGRLCASRSGLATHARRCRVELARSAAFVRSVELGLSRPMLAEAERRAILLARSSSDLDPRRMGDAAAERLHRALTRRACLLCPKRAGDGSDYCAEHDDPIPASACAPSNPLTPGGIR